MYCQRNVLDRNDCYYYTACLTKKTGMRWLRFMYWRQRLILTWLYKCTSFFFHSLSIILIQSIFNKMNYIFDDSETSSIASSTTKELSCGGQVCRKCGACRDWYQIRNSDDIIKRQNASCSCNYMHCHELVRLPFNNENEYYPRHNLICMCKDNY